MINYEYIRTILNLFLGFTPDVKIWEVVFTKTGDFKQISKAFDLAGHTSGVYDFDFCADSSLMASVSKDGTYRIYDTKGSNCCFSIIFANSIFYTLMEYYVSSFNKLNM